MSLFYPIFYFTFLFLLHFLPNLSFFLSNILPITLNYSLSSFYILLPFIYYFIIYFNSQIKLFVYTIITWHSLIILWCFLLTFLFLILFSFFIFISGPVSGGPGGASLGTLTVMIGGEKMIVERARLLIQCYSTNIIHFGAVGKLIHEHFLFIFLFIYFWFIYLFILFCFLIVWFFDIDKYHICM